MALFAFVIETFASIPNQHPRERTGKLKTKIQISLRSKTQQNPQLFVNLFSLCPQPMQCSPPLNSFSPPLLNPSLSPIPLKLALSLLLFFPHFLTSVHPLISSSTKTLPSLLFPPFPSPLLFPHLKPPPPSFLPFNLPPKHSYPS